MPVRVLALLAGVVLVSPARAQPLLERHTLTGDWNGVRPALSAHGLDLYLTYTGTMWGNLAGGRTSGVRWNGYLDVGAEQLAVTPWLVVQPDAQFFFEAAFSGRDAQALGIEVVAIF
jgi:carbohydrate-selective porin OprB